MTNHLMSALGQLTAETLEEQRARDAAQFPIEATDMVQQIPVDAKGTATRHPVWEEQDVEFPYPFLMNVAQSQSDSSLETPSFATGVELRTEEHVVLEAYVRSWIKNDAELITGATVRLVAWAPEAPKGVAYDATIHLHFMGYAAAAEEDDTATTATAPPETP